MTWRVKLRAQKDAQKQLARTSLSASGQVTGPVIAVSADHTAAAMALIRQDRSILGEEKEDRERQQVILSDNQDKDLFVDSLVEVKE